MTEEMTKLREICDTRLNELQLAEHHARLQEELHEIETQNEAKYLIDLHEQGVKYAENQNNLLVVYLLGIVAEVDFDSGPDYVMGEFPDVDIDYLGPVRDYLRHDWAPRTFGEQNVCAISNYTTFGLKSSFIDMARVHGLDTKEINIITKKLEMKDDEGKLLTFEKALTMYDDLREYCVHYPQVHDAVKRIVNRNRGMGTHAGGLVISSRRLDDFVPLVRGKDEAITSAWTEGLHGQDLGPMGLIKFDLLGITDLMRIAKACMLIKERHGLEHICSDPKVNHDWSDTAYLNDPKALAMARAGDLLGIFQFDSPGIRKLARNNVTSFDDLVAFSALYRPGPLGMGMHDVYVNRKSGREEYELHPVLQTILGKTYGVMVFQEQVMQILHAVGDIPLKDCEAVRKAISKKKVDKFIKYKEQFVSKGQIVLGWAEEEVVNLWQQIESFAEYGFNKSHSVAYTYISSRLLYLKAHYPVEFFAATLSCEKTIDKIKEYKRNAMAFGRRIRVSQIDVNKSKKDFNIDGESIYYGLADLKGIGEDSAERIMRGQPYVNLQDFLDRCSTEAKICTVLIELGCFGMDITRKMQFYEEYKDHYKKIADRGKRFTVSKAKFQNTIMGALGREHEIDFEGEWEAAVAAITETWATDDVRLKDVAKAVKAYARALEQNAKKNAEDTPPDLRLFKLGEIEKSDSDYSEIERAILLSGAESEHYGFRWVHPIELYHGHIEGQTYEMLRQHGESRYVELLIKNVVVKTTKKALETIAKAKKALVDLDPETAADIDWGDERAAARRFLGLNPSPQMAGAVDTYLDALDFAKKGGAFYSVTAEDANSEVNTINIWDVDWERFGNMLQLWVDPESGEKIGNLVRMELIPPNNGFPTYGLKTWRKHEYKRYAPKNVEEDLRFTLLAKAAVWKKW